MDWTQILTIAGINIALIAAMSTWIVWAINKVDSDVKGISSRMDSQANRMDGHAQRIDQLYQVILEMLKERK